MPSSRDRLAPLPPRALRPPCDPALVPFETTAEIDEVDGILGQQRAREALAFAIDMKHGGYNVYVLGPEGVGRRHLVMQLLQRRAADEAVPPDHVYVHRFDRPTEPELLTLPPGRGVELRAGLVRLVAELRPAIALAFESEQYLALRKALDEEYEGRQRARIAQIRAEADKRGVGVLSTPTGIALVPLQEGEPVSPEAAEGLPEEEQARINAAMDETREHVASTLRELPRWAREHQERVRTLDRRAVADAVEHLLEPLRERWADCAGVGAYLDALRDDVVEGREHFRETQELPALLAGMAGGTAGEWTRRYGANVLVDRSGQVGAPVVYEDNPTLANVVGRVEHHATMGTLVTDYSLIRAGALHRANGGYLVLEARKVLAQPASWEHLKRALRSNEIRIESLAQVLALTSTSSLEPQPVPLDLKVILVGDRQLFYLLSALDPEFQSFFKVPADIEEDMPRNDEQVRGFARLLAALVRSEGLRPFHRLAVARLVEQASRMAGDGEKLSTHIRDLIDLLREADHHAGLAGADTVGAEHVRQAVRADLDRRGRLRQRMLEAELRGLVRVRTDGQQVGQINGLSVAMVGRAPFGRPTRITARVQLGSKGVIDIEREVELGGPLHAKGVLILSGFIGARYAPQVPVAFSATLVFEQSYGGIEGDSASLAETLVLLSALGELPLAQGIAVTGSVDQHGEVQAIGGVNEKIEGFFELCATRGLTGQQGVVIPRANLAHLVLEDEVIQAVEAGRFSVWAVDSVDEALELLTGLPAGQREAEGAWPDGSANRRVEDRLVQLAEQARAWVARAQPTSTTVA